MAERVMIAVSGPTASGKSTFAGALAERLAGWSPVVLNQDRYFRSWSDLPEDERERARTTNHPRGVLWDELVAHLAALKAGESIRTPIPGTRSADRGEPASTVGPSRLVIVEGHLLYNREDLGALADLRIFMETHVHERVVRRLLRDTGRSGTTLEQATAWYRRDVAPNVGPFSEAMRGRADLVVPFDGPDNPKALAAVANWVEEKLGRG